MRSSAEISKEIQELGRKLDVLNAELRAAQMSENAVKEGMQVMYRGTVYKVTGFRFNHGAPGKPWAKGLPRLKDGSWGKLTKHLYDDWERI